MYLPLQGKPTLSAHMAPFPATIMCWGFMAAAISLSLTLPPPRAVSIRPLLLAVASTVSLSAPSSSCAMAWISISTWPISSVAMSRIMSLYLPGARQFQPWNMYIIMTLISPHCPPSGSCNRLANRASGLDGLQLYAGALTR